MSTKQMLKVMVGIDETNPKIETNGSETLNS